MPSLLCQIKRVNETQAVERLILAGAFVVGMFDVEGGDVVRQQHDLVGKKLLGVHASEVTLGDAAQEVHHEIPGSRAGVKNVHARVAEFLAELFLEHPLDARTHEIDNFLRRVDDAKGISRLDRVALKEALIDGVQEVLFLAEICQSSALRTR